MFINHYSKLLLTWSRQKGFGVRWQVDTLPFPLCPVLCVARVKALAALDKVNIVIHVVVIGSRNLFVAAVVVRISRKIYFSCDRHWIWRRHDEQRIFLKDLDRRTTDFQTWDVHLWSVRQLRVNHRRRNGLFDGGVDNGDVCVSVYNHCTLLWRSSSFSCRGRWWCFRCSFWLWRSYRCGLGSCLWLSCERAIVTSSGTFSSVEVGNSFAICWCNSVKIRELFS